MSVTRHLTCNAGQHMHMLVYSAVIFVHSQWSAEKKSSMLHVMLIPMLRWLNGRVCEMNEGARWTAGLSVRIEQECSESIEKPTLSDSSESKETYHGPTKIPYEHFVAVSPPGHNRFSAAEPFITDPNFALTRRSSLGVRKLKFYYLARACRSKRWYEVMVSWVDWILNTAAQLERKVETRVW